MSVPAPFSASTDRLDGVVVVHVAGDFDLVAVEPFRVEIERAAELASDRLVVDLSELAFVDSSGLRAMLGAHESLVARGLSVSFRRPPERLWRVFSVTGTDALLPFDDAPASAGGSSSGQNDA